MSNPAPEKDKKILPIIMAVIPAVLLILELIGLFFTANSEASASHFPGIFFVQFFSIIGIVILPFLSLVFEIIGLIFAVRWKQKPLIVIIAIELGWTVISVIFTFFLVYVGSKI